MQTWNLMCVWFNALPIWSRWAIWIGLGIIGSYIIYKYCIKYILRFMSWVRSKIFSKKGHSKLPGQNIEVQKNQERESQIECTNNSDSKIINNVYNM